MVPLLRVEGKEHVSLEEDACFNSCSLGQVKIAPPLSVEPPEIALRVFASFITCQLLAAS